MGCGLQYLLLDSLNRVWKLDLDSGANFRIVQQSGNAGNVLHLKALNADKAFRVDVNLAGMLFTTAEPYVYGYPEKIGLSGGVSQTWYLFVDQSGLLFLQFGDQTPQIVLGQLLPQEEGYPPALQPGGSGTPVTEPVQTIGEIRGRWRPGCGHSVNSWDIRRMSVACTPSAIVCCPICLYVQRVFTPYTLMYDIVQNPIIFA